MATIGWYGPLIDLSEASAHINHFVQLVVFVHKSTPIQYKLSREVIRTDIQVGDDTRPFFSVSIWQKQMGSLITAGDVILLQNVRITRFGDVVEARTVQHSSLRCLVHPYESIISEGGDDLIGHCRVGIMTKEKLRKVIKWVRRAEPTLHNVELHVYQWKRQPSINWKIYEETQCQECSSLLEVSSLTNSCKATFHACVGELFLPITLKCLHDSEEERMFISRRLYIMGEKNLVDDLICTGCQLCGAPLNLEFGHSEGFSIKQGTISLYCQKSSNRLHIVSLIYRPFMLYVCDDSKYIPLLVTNKAAELLFGNITAERVYSCYRRQNNAEKHDTKSVQPENYSHAGATLQSNAANGEISNSHSTRTYKEQRLKEKRQCEENPNFYLIWLILLKMLLQQEKNSPLKFKVKVNASKDWESGRHEMISVSMPCFRTDLPCA